MNLRRHPRAPRWGLAVVRGRSMEPTLREGDRLLVRYAAPPRPGRLAVVRFADGVVAVKRLDRPDADRPHGPAAWWVARDNPCEGRDSWSAGPADIVGIVSARCWPRPRLLLARAVRR